MSADLLWCVVILVAVLVLFGIFAYNALFGKPRNYPRDRRQP